jgi:hypothetical protein
MNGEMVGEKSAFSSTNLNISVNLAMTLSPIQIMIPASTSLGTKKIIFSTAILRNSYSLSMVKKV